MDKLGGNTPSFEIRSNGIADLENALRVRGSKISPCTDKRMRLSTCSAQKRVPAIPSG